MLLTNVVAKTELQQDTIVSSRAASKGAQTVMIINGNPESLAFLEVLVDAGHYDVVFVESVAHAYSQVKRVQPDLVILCVNIDDCDSLQVLSMLRLDEETRGIPVLTYATDDEVQEEEEEQEDGSGVHLFSSPPAILMN